MSRNLLFKSIAIVVAVAITIYSLAPVSAVFRVVRADDGSDEFKLIMLSILAMALSNMPLDQVERYELFHTLYIYRNGSMALVNQPYLDSNLVLNLTKIAIDIRNEIRSGQLNVSTVSNSTGIYIYVNNSLFMGLEYMSNDSSWSLWLGPVYNKSIDSNTVMYWREVKANYSDSIANYILIGLTRNVSTTHRIYVTTIGELTPDGSGYSYVFTLANYWFKNKTTFFGDWIVLPEGANTLSQYYNLIANGVKWLSANLYNGTSPGYAKTGGKGGYVPTAYPQIANALNGLANNIPKEIDKPVEKGYALVIDFPWLLAIGAIITAAGIAATIIGYAIGNRDLACYGAFAVGIGLLVLGAGINAAIRVGVIAISATTKEYISIGIGIGGILSGRVMGSNCRWPPPAGGWQTKLKNFIFN